MLGQVQKMEKNAKTLDKIAKQIRNEKTKAMTAIILHKGLFL